MTYTFLFVFENSKFGRGLEHHGTRRRVAGRPDAEGLIFPYSLTFSLGWWLEFCVGWLNMIPLVDYQIDVRSSSLCSLVCMILNEPGARTYLAETVMSEANSVARGVFGVQASNDGLCPVMSYAEDLAS